MKLFVTGGTGFIGSHFLNLASQQGHEVTALRRPGSVPRIPIDGQVKWVEGDLKLSVGDVFEKQDTLVHLAAAGVTSHQTDWRYCFEWNVTASLECWLAAWEAGIRQFVIVGSCFEYGKVGEQLESIPSSAPLLPTAAYHASKAAASMAAIGFCHDKQVQLSLLRPFHVYGPGEAPNRFWPSLRQAASSGNDFPMTHGEQIRDFTPVEYVAETILNECTCTDVPIGKPAIRNLGTGNPRSLLEFAKGIWKEMDAKGKILPGEIAYRPNEVMRYVPSMEKDQPCE